MVKRDWIEGNLKITRRAVEVIEAAAKAAYGRDEEACGYLTGPDSDPRLADCAVELENLANKYHHVDPEGHPRTGREYFKINSLKFEKAIKASEEAGAPVKVFFHSHLDCGAYFSDEDAASMLMGDGSAPSYELCYLVTAVDEGIVTRHRLFIWDTRERAFVESPFTVLEA